MLNSTDVLMPLRNPTPVLLESIKSLTAQSRKEFRVLLSDNHSTNGLEILEQAGKLLDEAGLECLRLKPPEDLGRVEHWNWLHYRSDAAWLKPLFAGDLLDEAYFKTIEEIHSQEPLADYIYSSYRLAAHDEVKKIHCHWSGYHTASEMRRGVMAYGMQFGPPSAALYRARVFRKLGGYEPTLPICADSLLFCRMAACFGVYGIDQPLVTFQIHGARFSAALPEKQKEVQAEKKRFIFTLLLEAIHGRWSFSWWQWIKFVRRELFSSGDVRDNRS